MIIPAILATQARSVDHSDWSTGVTSPKALMDSWLSCAKFWEFTFFQELLPLARAV
jgi:hypothetical protein